MGVALALFVRSVAPLLGVDGDRVFYPTILMVIASCERIVSGALTKHCQKTNPARRASCLRGFGVQLDAERACHLEDGGEARIPIRVECPTKTTPCDVGVLAAGLLMADYA